MTFPANQEHDDLVNNIVAGGEWNERKMERVMWNLHLRVKPGSVETHFVHL